MKIAWRAVQIVARKTHSPSVHVLDKAGTFEKNGKASQHKKKLTVMMVSSPEEKEQENVGDGK